MSKPIIKAEINDNVPVLEVNTPSDYVPVIPIETSGSDPILDTLTVTENGAYTPPSGVDGYDEVNVNVSDIPPVLNTLNVTENGTYTPPTGVDGYNEVNVNVPPSMPNLELVCSYDFTSETPKKDNARYNVTGNSNYISFDTTKGAVFDSASSRFFNSLYNMNEGNSYKIEIEFGDIVLNETLTGKRNFFSYVPNSTTINENSNSLGWDVSNNQFRYHTGAGDRFINKPVDYWKNDTMTIYYGLSVDNEGKLWLPNPNIDNSSYKSLIIMDKDLITELTAPFQQDNPNIVLGGGNNMYYFEVKSFKIYKINNLIEKPINLI